MVTKKRDGLWQALRPLLSVGVLLLMPLLWGDEGCGQGQRTGYALFGKHSTAWVPLTLIIVCAADFIGRRVPPGQALVGHIVAFIVSLYLGFSSLVHTAFLHRARFPAPLTTLLLIALFIDSARSVGQAFLALARDTPSASDAPPGALRRILIVVVPILVGVLMVAGQVLSPRRSHFPVEPTESVAKLAQLEPPLPMSFADAKILELVSERSAPTLGKLPITPPSPMWRGTVWQSPRGAGFGRHHPHVVHPLPGEDFMLVSADSGLWILETKSLVRRARLRTGELHALDISHDGKHIAYAECAPGDSWKHPCDLVVVRVPDFTEEHRSEIRFPKQLRFSRKADVIAVSGGHYFAVVVIPLDSSKPSWNTTALSSAVAAVPLSETRVAYIGGSGQLVIEEKDRKEPLYLGRGDPPVMEFPFRLGIARHGGEIVYDAATDRVIEPQRNDAQVIEFASTEKPRKGQPLTRDELDAFPSIVRNHQAESLDQRFGKKQFRYMLNIDGIHGFVDPQGDVIGLARDYVVRVTRDGVMRAADFGASDTTWKTSISPFDILFYYETSGKEKLLRIELGTPALDKAPEPIAEFDTEDDHPPLIFSNGDRVIFRFEKGERESILRLPRGGTLSAPVPLPISGLSLNSTDVLRVEDRFAFLTMRGSLVEITRDKVQLLTTAEFGASLKFDEKSKCWKISEGGRGRLVGEGCATK